MSADNASKPVIFIHGLWLHAESWDNWVQLFKLNGYAASAASWPGDGPTTEATRQYPEAVADYGVRAVAEYIAGQIKPLPQKPIAIGHSFGGLLAQNLLGRDLVSAAIAIDPAPIQGVWELPPSVLKASMPVLGNPFNFKRAVSLSEGQFRYGFTNAVSEQEARELYIKYAMPSPARPLFQAATATFNPNAETKVNTANEMRGPLLLIAGEKDHIVPPVLVKSALRQYHKSKAATELKQFAGRGHSLVIDSGWREIAEYCLGWLRSKGL